MAIRGIKKVLKGIPTTEGAGVHLRRVFGFHHVGEFDPFLLLDDFRSSEPRYFTKGFPWHPHRGIETITYILDGDVEHGDSLGNSGVISAGEMQWMTAGSGIIHQEMPKGTPEGNLAGFQLWGNLPAKQKMMDPKYRGIKSDEIPSVDMEGGATARIVAGKIGGVKGPVDDIVTDPQYFDVAIPSGKKITIPAKPGHTVLAYVIKGKAFFCSEKSAFAYEKEGENYFDMEEDPFVRDGMLVHFEDGDAIQVETTDEPVRFLFISGRPLNEPIAWYGPIVMNTQEELETAFEEYRNGTFIKTGA